MLYYSVFVLVYIICVYCSISSTNTSLLYYSTVQYDIADMCVNNVSDYIIEV